MNNGFNMELYTALAEITKKINDRIEDKELKNLIREYTKTLCIMINQVYIFRNEKDASDDINIISFLGGYG